MLTTFSGTVGGQVRQVLLYYVSHCFNFLKEMNEMVLMSRWYMLPCVSHCPSHFKMLLHWVQRLNFVRIVCVLVCEEEERQEDSELHIETVTYDI